MIRKIAEWIKLQRLKWNLIKELKLIEKRGEYYLILDKPLDVDEMGRQAIEKGDHIIFGDKKGE